MDSKQKEFLDDCEKWDNRELGADERYVQVASDDEVGALKKALGIKDKDDK